MLPHIHLIFGMTFLNVIYLPDINDLDAFLFLIGNLTPDLDFIIARKLNVNHRRLPSHFPFLWFILTILTLILRFPIFWLFWGGFLHLIVDTLDWEVILLGPMFSHSFSFLSIKFEDEYRTKPLLHLLKAYYSDRRILFIEAIFFLVYILSLLTR
ncbi:MAG: metal-dependent hydrolase [Candidatus Heimdallarchaeota archaeon]